MIPIPYPIYIEKKIQDLEQELPSLLQSYELRGKQPFVSDFRHLLRHAIQKGRGPILYSKKTAGSAWMGDQAIAYFIWWQLLDITYCQIEVA